MQNLYIGNDTKLAVRRYLKQNSNASAPSLVINNFID